MESPQLHSLGFDAEDLDSLTSAAFSAGVRGIDQVPGFALIGTYTDPSGARLAFVQRDGQPIDTAATLKSDVSYRAQVLRFTDHMARVTLYANDAEGEQLAQYLALVDDPVCYEQHDPGTDGHDTLIDALQVGMLALDVAVFDDEAAFLASDEARIGNVLLDTHALMSPSLMALFAGSISPDEATPNVLMSAVVDAVEVRRNALTGVDFQYATVTSEATFGVALPLDAPVAPGNIIFGTFQAGASSGLWDA